MNRSYPVRPCLFAALLTLSWACATPVPPGGGPRDTTPPMLVGSVPEKNSVNFSSDRVTLTFSEKVDRASFQQALSFTPDIAIPPKLDWHGASVDLVLRAPLRDSTTYILTLDKQLKDYRSVSLDQPITLAFSTGPEIDTGSIAGRVMEANSNSPVEGLDVLAFESSKVDSIGSGEWRLIGVAPTYRTQTDSDGRFVFGNLPDRAFAVVAVEDRNRSRVIDSTEVVALPAAGLIMPDTTAPVLSSGRAASKTWFLHRTDARPPRLNSVQALSASRIELRFSEPVRLDRLEPDRWSITDTLGLTTYSVGSVYVAPHDQSRIVLTSAPLPSGHFRLDESDIVRDTVGNVADGLSALTFAAHSEADTMKTRFLGFGPIGATVGIVSEIGFGMRPTVSLNQFVPPARLAELVRARVHPADTTRSPQTELQLAFTSSDGTTWMVDANPPIARGDTLVLEVTGVEPGDTTYTGVYPIPEDASVGGVSGVAVADGPVMLELLGTQPDRRFSVSADSLGVFAYPRMLKGGYRLRVFEDLNGNRTWDPGTIDPFRLPEPLVWYHEDIEVRKGWETVVDTIRFAD